MDTYITPLSFVVKSRAMSDFPFGLWSFLGLVLFALVFLVSFFWGTWRGHCRIMLPRFLPFWNPSFTNASRGWAAWMWLCIIAVLLFMVGNYVSYMCCVEIGCDCLQLG